MAEPAKSKKAAPATKSKSADTTAAKASDSTSSDSTSSDSTSSDSNTSTSSSSGGGGKSSRESVGGSGAVHYGFFSNIKSPEYKSGWDDIWGGEKSKPKKKAAAKSTVRKVTRKKDPVIISLSMDDLPAELQNELASVARARLKKSRVNYDSRDKAGAVSWQIECEVKR